MEAALRERVLWCCIGAYVGNEGDKKVQEVQCVRNVSCHGFDLGKVYMENRIRLLFGRKKGLSDEDAMGVNQKIACVVPTVGFKRLQDILRVTVVQLQLLSDYYCWKDYADRDEIKD
ncbi:hypothetical protein Tco_0381593 [Tanacetum coccineum]